MDDLANWARFMATLIPYSLVWMVGIIVALIRWRRHPAVSLLASIGMVLILIALLGGGTLQFWIIQRSSFSSGYLSVLLQMLGVGRMVFSVTGGILLLCALFGWRGRPSSLALYDETRRDRDYENNDYGEGPRGSENIRKPYP